MEQKSSKSVLFLTGCLIGELASKIEFADLTDKEKRFSEVRKHAEIRLLYVLETLETINQKIGRAHV